MKAEHTLEFKYVLRNKMIGEEGNLKREVTEEELLNEMKIICAKKIKLEGA